MSRYFVVSNTNTGDLIHEVNRHLAEGCQLVGGVAASHDTRSDRMCFVQALTRLLSQITFDKGTPT